MSMYPLLWVVTLHVRGKSGPWFEELFSCRSEDQDGAVKEAVAKARTEFVDVDPNPVRVEY
jgi:hypothetical protein